MAQPPLHKLYIEDSPRRVRVLFGGQFIVDTEKAKLVWEHKYYPNYFFAQDSLNTKYLQLSSQKAAEDGRQVYDVVVGDETAKDAVTVYDQNAGELAGLLKITFGAMDAWFEEEEQIHGHPKDPYKRVDVLQSSRHVRVEVKGVEVANTHSPLRLFETSLPVRTYIRKTDCRLDLLKPSELTSLCPYKGVANYYDVQLGAEHGNELVKDIVWWYKNPILECALIRGYIAFYDEKVDVWVDGVKQEKPSLKH